MNLKIHQQIKVFVVFFVAFFSRIYKMFYFLKTT